MTSRAPETIAKEIGEGINALILQSDVLRSYDDPKVATLLEGATKLQKVDARASFSMRGTLAALCGDIEGTHEFFRKALLQPNQDSTRQEYWVALLNAGLYAAASHEGSWLLEPRRHLFPALWRRIASAGQIREVWARLPQVQQTFPDLAKEDSSWLESAAAVMSEAGLTDKQLISVLDLMGEVQRAHRMMFNGQLVTHVRVMAPPDDPPYLHLPIWVDGSFALVHQMNRDLARLIVQRMPNGMFPPGVVGSFEKAPLAEVKAAA